MSVLTSEKLSMCVWPRLTRWLPSLRYGVYRWGVFTYCITLYYTVDNVIIMLFIVVIAKYMPIIVQKFFHFKVISCCNKNDKQIKFNILALKINVCACTEIIHFIFLLMKMEFWMHNKFLIHVNHIMYSL